MVNALYAWGLARATGRGVLLRIEDHDRQRSRPAFDAALLEDLEWLGFTPDAGPVRQSDDGPVYAAAARRLREAGLLYACDCSRATFAAWDEEHGGPWRGPGCPGGCAARGLPEGAGTALRVSLGPGDETWTDLRLGPQTGEVAGDADLIVRDRVGNWTYGLCVVVDDARQAIDLVVRGEDLREATPGQVRLGRLLGRDAPPVFLHHPLVRKPGGSKLSKADRDTSVRDLRAAGRSAETLIGEAAAAVGLLDRARPVRADEAATLVAAGR